MASKVYYTGDRPRVKKGLEPDRKYGGILFTKSMQAFCGEAVEIVEVKKLGGFLLYKIRTCVLYWSGEMFEEIEKISDEEKLKTLDASDKLFDMLGF